MAATPPQPKPNPRLAAIATRAAQGRSQLSHESRNAAQDEDEGEQAQSLAGEALGRDSSFGFGNSERVPSRGFDEVGGSVPDLVDHMKQMVRDGRIDMSAFRGERNDDDVEEGLGPQGLEDDGPRGAE
jgi:hypothetical protein